MMLGLHDAECVVQLMYLMIDVMDLVSHLLYVFLDPLRAFLLSSDPLRTSLLSSEGPLRTMQMQMQMDVMPYLRPLTMDEPPD